MFFIISLPFVLPKIQLFLRQITFRTLIFKTVIRFSSNGLFSTAFLPFYCFLCFRIVTTSPRCVKINGFGQSRRLFWYTTLLFCFCLCNVYFIDDRFIYFLWCEFYLMIFFGYGSKNTMKIILKIGFHFRWYFPHNILIIK